MSDTPYLLAISDTTLLPSRVSPEEKEAMDTILGHPVRPATDAELEHLRSVYTWLLEEWTPAQPSNRQVDIGMGDHAGRPALLARLSVMHTSPVDGQTSTLSVDAVTTEYDPDGPLLECVQALLPQLAVGMARSVCSRFN